MGADSVAATDADVEMDRNATVASSGLGGEDSESSSSLFGDAAAKDEPAFGSSGMESENSMDDNTSFSSQETDFGEEAEHWLDQASFHHLNQ